jgi:hypothetical protein
MHNAGGNNVAGGSGGVCSGRAADSPEQHICDGDSPMDYLHPPTHSMGGLTDEESLFATYLQHPGSGLGLQEDGPGGGSTIVV